MNSGAWAQRIFISGSELVIEEAGLKNVQPLNV